MGVSCFFVPDSAAEGNGIAESGCCEMSLLWRFNAGARQPLSWTRILDDWRKKEERARRHILVRSLFVGLGPRARRRRGPESEACRFRNKRPSLGGACAETQPWAGKPRRLLKQFPLYASVFRSSRSRILVLAGGIEAASVVTKGARCSPFFPSRQTDMRGPSDTPTRGRADSSETWMLQVRAWPLMGCNPSYTPAATTPPVHVGRRPGCRSVFSNGRGDSSVSAPALRQLPPTGFLAALRDGRPVGSSSEVPGLTGMWSVAPGNGHAVLALAGVLQVRLVHLGIPLIEQAAPQSGFSVLAAERKKSSICHLAVSIFSRIGT